MGIGSASESGTLKSYQQEGDWGSRGIGSRGRHHFRGNCISPNLCYLLPVPVYWDMGDVTHMLNLSQQVEPKSADQLLPLVYQELRRLAGRQVACQVPGQPLQPTALVHEAWGFEKTVSPLDSTLGGVEDEKLLCYAWRSCFLANTIYLSVPADNHNIPL